MDRNNWRNKISDHLQLDWKISKNNSEEAVLFFEKAFSYTRCYDRAWFGIHKDMVSLVIGGIFLAALVNSGNDKGVWLLVDQDAPTLNLIKYQPVKSTQKSKSPLIWAHSMNFDALHEIIESSEIWISYSEASEKVLDASFSSTDRDDVQIRRNKIRLVDIFPARDLSIYNIALNINNRASRYSIGGLQDIRTELKGLKRRPGSNIFSSRTISDEWAFHNGGRSELQFNIGWEYESGFRELRHGVAFSFETSQTLPSIEVLVPKVRLFNDFMRIHPDLYSDMHMWWYYEEKRSSDYPPVPIEHDLVTEGCFVFLGKRQPADKIDYDTILGDFDRLLPLYRYIEGNGSSYPTILPPNSPFTFKPGYSTKISSTLATYTQKQLNVNLLHNQMQETLFQRLVSQYEEENVGTELVSGVGTSVDIVVRTVQGYIFYEIKTALTPRACLREAIGQLLEYSFWPGAQSAIKLVVVGERPIDDDCAEYLRRLNLRFPLPINYEQIIL
jgi:hypothetical protein